MTDRAAEIAKEFGWCPDCHGEGDVWQGGRYVTCLKCDGTGKKASTHG
jgi:DnaJ-class molecular chaperone